LKKIKLFGNQKFEPKLSGTRSFRFRYG